ncbi:unnamed protein product [Adineta steineri]|uniref:Feruloyl esterase n=2 Tax=Adineta steineri TaxID=433720 RepID=A0A819EJY9_9BILA|nr:unnamed protein product [Adineta steineri]
MQTLLLLIIYIFNAINFLSLSNASLIPNFMNAKVQENCTEKYGSPPAERVVTLDTGFIFFNLCANISDFITTFNFTDSNGDVRGACLITAQSTRPLPLLVWLHPAMFPTSSISLTGLLEQANKANLTGTSDGPLGYHILMPYGRSTTHIYPPPADQGIGWDNWYRNYNRSDPALNVDVQAIDYSINKVLTTQSNDYQIDKSRVFLSGWSNGAAMAVIYALNTPGIAAAAVYSPPDPYRDYNDLCAQDPYPTDFTPILLLYNRCDVINICVTGANFIEDLNNRYCDLTAEIVIIDSDLQRTSECDKSCTAEFGIGLLRHTRWPSSCNDDILFDFFRKHPLVEYSFKNQHK